jgi:hypothetical protein
MLTVRLLPQVQHDSYGFVSQQNVAPCNFHMAVRNYLNTHRPWCWFVLVWAGDLASCRWPSLPPAFNSGRHLMELLVYERQVCRAASEAMFARAEVANCRCMASLCTEFGTSCIALSAAALWYAERIFGFCEMCEKLLNVCWLIWMWYHSSTFASVRVWRSVVLFWPLYSWGFGMMLVPDLSTFGAWLSRRVWGEKKL